VTNTLKSVHLLREQSRVTQSGLRRGHELGLSTLQIEVLALLSDGLTVHQAAARLGTTADTVRYRALATREAMGLGGATRGERGARAATVSRLFAAGVLPVLPSTAPGFTLVKLTRREAQVALGMAVGAGNEKIAARLDVTTATVKSHAHSLTAALGANGRAHAVRRAFELGLLQATPPLDGEEGVLCSVWVRQFRDADWWLSAPLR